MKINNVTKLSISIGLALLTGVIGSLFTSSAVNGWYLTIEKPALNPPSWIFGPVWTLLYVLMGIAAFIVWKKGWSRRDVRLALFIFVFQLFLNASWSIIFFGLKSPGWALLELIILWFVIIWMMIVFYKISKSTIYLILPYLLWISFAGYLNYAIWSLN